MTLAYRRFERVRGFGRRGNQGRERAGWTRPRSVPPVPVSSIRRVGSVHSATSRWNEWARDC